MRLERVLALLVVIVLIAAAVVFFVRRPAIEGPTGALQPLPDEGELGLLVVGIQGLEESVAMRLVEAGRMPNLASLIERGALATYSTLGRDVDPKITWTSIVTGMSPENQGVGGKMRWKGSMADAPLTPQYRTVGTIWTYLSDSGQTCGVVSWPGTWPVEEINGVMVGPVSTYILERVHAGKPSDAVYPVSYLDRVDGQIRGRQELTRRDLTRFINTDSALGLEALIGQNYTTLADATATDRSAVDVARLLVDDPGVQNMFVCLIGMDSVSQRFWHYMDLESLDAVPLGEEERDLLNRQAEALSGTVDAYCEYIDELLGELMNLVGDGGTVALISSYGYRGIVLDDKGFPLIGTHMHSEEGFWAIAGPGVRSGSTADPGSVLDFAPTLMAASGVTPTIDLDGSVHGEVIAR